MSTTRDPIFDSLDRLATMADDDVVPDRMAGIHQRARVAHRRKAAGVVVAAATAVIAGLGVWQALPDGPRRPAPAPAPAPSPSPTSEVWQEIEITRLEAIDTTHVALVYAISGRSYVYSDPVTGEEGGYAGPSSVMVSIDGEFTDAGGEGGALICQASTTLRDYQATYHPRGDPYVLIVDGPGEHEVVIEAPYCGADGKVVEQTVRKTFTTEAPAEPPLDELSTDLDRDGAPETLTLTLPPSGPAQVKVVWGTGETTTVEALPDLDGGFAELVDVNANGRLDVVVSQGGGELEVTTIFLTDGHRLVPVETFDADGAELPLTTDGTDGSTGWRIFIGQDGLVLSYRLREAGGGSPPLPVEFRTWTMSGHRLTQSSDNQEGCLKADFTVSKNPC